MSAEKLISTMENLLKLHKSLYELAQKKTDIVKKGDINALNKVLKDEQTHIAAITKMENDRQKITAVLVPDIEKPTLEDCFNVVDNNVHKTLERLRTALVDVISQIKQRNDLNQQMIYQSLQFVNFSLNLIAPQPENINYGPTARKVNSALPSAGLFNSKA